MLAIFLPPSLARSKNTTWNIRSVLRSREKSSRIAITNCENKSRSFRKTITHRTNITYKSIDARFTTLNRPENDCGSFVDHFLARSVNALERRISVKSRKSSVSYNTRRQMLASDARQVDRWWIIIRLLISLIICSNIAMDNVPDGTIQLIDVQG